MKPILFLLLALLGLHRASAFYATNGPVVELTDSNYHSKIKSSGFFLVEFYAPWCGHCQSLKPAWEKAASALRGIVPVGALDADQHKGIAGEQGIRGFPTIKFAYVDSKTGDIKTVAYQGAREAKEIVEFALQKAHSLAMKRLSGKSSTKTNNGDSRDGQQKQRHKGGGSGDESSQGFYKDGSSDVINLDSSSFQKKVLTAKSNEFWFVEFYAPWCRHCKDLRPIWSEAASRLKGRVSLGAVDCTAAANGDLCSRVGVEGYPTLKLFRGGNAEPEDFKGSRDADAIVQFASGRWAAAQPPPEAVEISDLASWSKCIGSEAIREGDDSTPASRLCVVAFLPDIRDSRTEGRRGYLKQLSKVAGKFMGLPYSVMWAAGGAQPELESGFGVGGSGYPAIVAYNPTEKKYVAFRGAFDGAAVASWIDTVRSGGARAVPLNGALRVLENGAWDGQDAPEEVEDEFSMYSK
mmetsp:Transcript_20387/g.36576  ORF Transcript_20387/g.36576 Transcript_20387/m.36576 type:complete len:465 (-) Transcript_20387:700-2094(-)|eukprot:CAMPEP_0175076236 /NCGR_PEP_ID=MMETSP0052_2-20121109/22585_1 /TAXON_ID=51329 ORGANISM="Polytomella parva, Strain SAG 63-3" /NCGR_SAMPLE_ID=MMETSP0052_2 /ASSEMBLY_ACC=CAM_ASM_000194 /LENGTH=464 /DNA_ID=CAMNT_0016345293 /DNA_START=67 /DNA_END=1461 /DNA_ORIENTATION=-